jgi:hypothetical protein
MFLYRRQRQKPAGDAPNMSVMIKAFPNTSSISVSRVDSMVQLSDGSNKPKSRAAQWRPASQGGGTVSRQQTIQASGIFQGMARTQPKKVAKQLFSLLSGILRNSLKVSWSGRCDLNARPSEPHSDALAKLRYAPTG